MYNTQNNSLLPPSYENATHSSGDLQDHSSEQDVFLSLESSPRSSSSIYSLHRELVSFDLEDLSPPKKFINVKYLYYRFRQRVEWVFSCLDTIRPICANTGSFRNAVLVLFCVSIIVLFNYLHILPPWNSKSLEKHDIQRYILTAPSIGRMRRHISYLSSKNTMPGTKSAWEVTLYVQDQLKSYGLDQVNLSKYFVYLNFPKEDGRKVAIVDPPELQYEAPLREREAEGEPLVTLPPTPSSLSPVYPSNGLVFHGHSKAGNVFGHLIYANYGSREDFEYLVAGNISVNGSIVLVRNGESRSSQASKVKAAQEAGAVGCIIYFDPADTGFLKGDIYPDGIWGDQYSVERGSVSLTSHAPGDVLTPGYAASLSAKRISKDNNSALVNIPSIPLSWSDAQPLLQALKNRGKKLEEPWKGGVPDVEWWTGDSTGPRVNLVNEQREEEKQEINNIIGKIDGREQNTLQIIVGNHRDAWGPGASNPHSGTAVLLEVARILGSLVKQSKWRPRRSIIFASWDAKEYNIIGSTEYVEDNLLSLKNGGVAYINVDTAVAGPKFKANASPLLNDVLMRIMDLVQDPHSNKTLLEEWGDQVPGPLAADSDYVAFQDFAGVASLDMSFDGRTGVDHTAHDSIRWLENFGDPGFKYHRAMAQLWALLILELADEAVMPINVISYGNSISLYINQLESYALSHDAKDLKFDELREAARSLTQNAEIFRLWEQEWAAFVQSSQGYETSFVMLARYNYNIRMEQFEKLFLDSKGLPGREWYKHVIFGPQVWPGCNNFTFPGVLDAIDQRNLILAQGEIDKIAKIVTQAGESLIS
ncbi:putative glutamate carboxypeptidase [Neolecta irregularis DAH-3]|uniref:Putative glutamate carboxypeptidase n=1 Tax=Neolecta irregularis (strain DAH-3) TaxID=1198029 RepID=A0A1U7LNP6_NEOID|nr:putative glutamate carboxypeptidase [Neolecta irregularis DAH-3]|eukprot:OLL24274.1 putative glutamate carboxypeptidase [Neolecta irregularis DAH-3]